MKINVVTTGVVEIITYASSTIQHSVMNTKTNQLIITFKKQNDGPVTEYQYDNVLTESYELFRDAPSTGKAFLQYIKPYYGLKIID